MGVYTFMKTKQQKRISKKRKEILRELKDGVSKTPLIKLKILFGVNE